jgi:hypothetical protein
MPFVTFLNMLDFYSEKLLEPRPTPIQQDNPLSYICDCFKYI